MVSAKRVAALRRDADAEEVSGIHNLSLTTIKERRGGLEELSSVLRCISNEARDLVDSIDVPSGRSSSELPAEPVSKEEEMPPQTQEKLEQKLVVMSELIQKMAGPVSEALDEIYKSRRSRWVMLTVFSIMTFLNVAVSIYVVKENTHLVERVELLQSEFKAHLISSGLREAQVEQLIKLAQEHASSDETKAELRKLTELVNTPSKQALEAAGRAVQQGVPLDKAIRQAVTSSASHGAPKQD